MNIPESIMLDPLLKCSETNELATSLKELVIGQDEAIDTIVNIIQTYRAGMHEPNRPLATMLMLGSSGCGKTSCVESLAKILFNNDQGFIKINCGELNNQSSSATLVGALPGYIGYKSGETIITQEKLDKYKTRESPISLVLFDEIEKASDSIYQSILNILDRGKLRLNTGSEVDFTNTIIFMTSNLGAREFEEANSSGFTHKNSASIKSHNKISKDVIKHAEKHFTPEFMNRLNHVIVFNTLSKMQIKQILNIELIKVRRAIGISKSNTKYTFICTQELEDHIIELGYSPKYGARHLKRTINKLVREPLSNISMTGQIVFGDLIILSINTNKEIIYEKISGEDIYSYDESAWEEVREYIRKKDAKEVAMMLNQEG